MHSTKRLYFPDAVEPDTQYDKYPILPCYGSIEEMCKDRKIDFHKYPILIPPITIEMVMSEAWQQFIAQKRDNYYHDL